jgi:DNA-binding IclR family transcriptional regulator
VIQSVDRAIRILFALRDQRLIGITELAGRLELAPSTVHGIVKTLAAAGMVVKDGESGRYQLGPAVLPIGTAYLDALAKRERDTAAVSASGARAKSSASPHRSPRRPKYPPDRVAHDDSSSKDSASV